MSHANCMYQLLSTQKLRFIVDLADARGGRASSR